jgi:sporulation protein YlmC with PRC-barrel domain
VGNQPRSGPFGFKDFGILKRRKAVLKTTMTAAFALMMAASLPVYAQTSSSSDTTAAPAGKVTATHLQPGQIRATQMDGSTVYDTQNQKVGDIKDIILDRDGKVAAVVLDVGAFLGMGGKYVALAMNDLKITNDNNSNKPRFTVDMTKDQLKAAQAYDLNANNNNRTGTSSPPADTNRPANAR